MPWGFFLHACGESLLMCANHFTSLQTYSVNVYRVSDNLTIRVASLTHIASGRAAIMFSGGAASMNVFSVDLMTFFFELTYYFFGSK
jgi:hypothetical protein